ncbi:major capsid protein [robinz microvirus RP_65]|nr:major capsid protein [robinz microvirus RP_65]
MTFPIMHRVNVTMHYFFVPHRILWDKFDKFISNQPDPVTVPAFPTVIMDDANSIIGRLPDYLGIPPAFPMTTEIVSAIPFACYQAIWNEYYRDQNQQTETVYKLVNGDNTSNAALFPLRKRAWGHDYFTSALPEPQAGDAVTIPIDGFNDVPIAAHEIADGTSSVVTGIEQPGAIAVGYAIDIDNTLPDDGKLVARTSLIDQMTTTITDFRRAEAVQKFLERLNLSGKRLKEFIWGMFGVETQDQRLDRPEYITGIKTPVVISEVLNTTGTSERPQGDQAGHAISVGNGNYAQYRCYEHGYIMGICSVIPMTAYQQGIEKHWLKYTDAFQHFFNQLEHVGEQEIQNREVYAFQGDIAGDQTFGYVPRYAEYKYANNRVAGDFRNSLQFMHWGRIFETAPSLNSDFIECVPRQDIWAVEGEVDHIYAHILHNIKAVRGMSKFGTPSI